MIFEDTICAIASPPGTGALSLIRLSGPGALIICERIAGIVVRKLEHAKARLLTIKDNDTLLDESVITYFRAPNSYTGEDIVEISCHGSVYIQNEILALLIRNGARLAKPGEFTQRAFLNGKMDLSQAEGVADLIATSTQQAHKIASYQMRGGFSNEINALRDKLLKFVTLIELENDFSEEDVEFADRKELQALITEILTKIKSLIDSFRQGNAIKNGIPVAIVGNPNVGKSTLLNALLNEEKAIVTEIPGKTRDIIEDTISLGGYLFRFIDTAGIRETKDRIENLGIERTYDRISKADIILLVSEHKEDHVQILNLIRENSREDAAILMLINKSDLVKKKFEQGSPGCDILEISATLKTNFDLLVNKLTEIAAKITHSGNDVIVSNARHYEALRKTGEAIARASDGLDNKLSSDLLAMDIREAIHYLGEITGEITTTELLGEIFRNFCIGK